MWSDFLVFDPSIQNVVALTTFHQAVVRKVEGDPLGMGRIQVECPDLHGVGEENYTNYVDVCGLPIGGGYNKGDCGIYWPMQPRQTVLYGYAAGDMLQPIAIPSGTVAESVDDKTGHLPIEVRNAQKKGKEHLVYMLKTPAGHTIYMGDETGKETLSVKHAAGFGLNLIGGFKGSEPTQSEGKETQPRTAERRGDKCVGCQTSKSPGELLKDGNAIVQLASLNGSGICIQDSDDGGTLLISVHNSNGSSQGPSFYMSTKEGGVILLTAGSAQLQVRGNKGDVKVTKQIVQEAIKEEVETKYTQRLKDYVKNFMKAATYFLGGGSNE